MKKGLVTPNKIICRGDICYIYLTQGKVGKFSIESLEKVKKYHWHFHTNKRTQYMRSSHGQGSVYMHVLLLGKKPKMNVDHINRNGLDNRLENLRFVSLGENNFNSKIKKTNTSGVTGVIFHKRRNKWQARISHKNKRFNLGYFIKKQDAIDARNIAEKKYYEGIKLLPSN